MIIIHTSKVIALTYGKVPLIARLVLTGDNYGLNDMLTNDEKEPLLEFFDSRYTEKFTCIGQFITRYYLTTLEESVEKWKASVVHNPVLKYQRLALDGGIDEWQIEMKELARACDWARAAMILVENGNHPVGVVDQSAKGVF